MRIISIIFLALFAASVRADDALAIARLLIDRAELEARIREQYSVAFDVASRSTEVRKAVDAYMKESFPWDEVEKIATQAVRTALSEKEQAEVLHFIKSPVGLKYRNISSGAHWRPVSDLLDQEGRKLFAVIEKAVQK